MLVLWGHYMWRENDGEEDGEEEEEEEEEKGKEDYSDMKCHERVTTKRKVHSIWAILVVMVMRYLKGISGAELTHFQDRRWEGK